jgi:glycine hydroxymethyltransferase
MKITSLAQHDPAVAQALNNELNRIEYTLDLIASENYTSMHVMQTTGSVMTNKYAEGYPARRYYGGCEFVDTAEILAQERLLKLFNLDPERYHANVQPHSGAQANMAAYFAILQPGDAILGMDLAAGGHLTHGYKINYSGVFYKPFNYTVDQKTECLDYGKIRELAQEHKPKLIIAGASAYSRIIDFKAFKTIADEVGAKLLVDMAHIAGLIAAKQHPAPFQYADIVTSTTHKTLRGPRGGIILCKKEYANAIDKAVMPGIQGGPLMHHIAAKAVAFKEALDHSFTTYQKQVIENAQAMANAFIKKGYRVVSGGTDNHLMIIDLRSKVLMQAGITLNKNCIPFDPEKPMVTSGIRVGTPAVTTRGFKQQEIEQVVTLIDRVLTDYENQTELEAVRVAVKDLCIKFPVYPALL